MTPSFLTPSAPAEHDPAQNPAPLTSHRDSNDKTLGEITVLIGLAGDAAVATASLLLSRWLQIHLALGGGGSPTRPADLSPGDVGWVIYGVLALLGCLEFQGVYRRQVLLDSRRVLARVIRGVATWLVCCAGLAFIFQLGQSVSREFVIASAALGTASLLAWRWGFHRYLKTGASASHLRQRVVLLGWTREAGQLASEVWKYETDPYEIVGYINLRGDQSLETAEAATLPYLGELDEAAAILAAEHADIALLADLGTDFGTTQKLVSLCERELIQFKIIPSYFPILVSGLHVEMVSGTPLLGIERLPLNRLGNRLLKRAFDIAGSLVGLVLSAPIIAVFGTIVYLESPGPIFYRQRRLGDRGQCFRMIKIRSMRLDAETPGKVGWTTKNDPRRLKIGALMRKWNVDELPQFWNVLKGEMSLVGPRPERPELIADFKHAIAHYNARHFIKPGLTGWAQVNGLRGDTDLGERIRHDLHYIEHWSLWLDVRTMLLTFFKRQNAC